MSPSPNSNRTYRRRTSFVDCALALSIIAGLAFVTVRVMGMATPPTVTQTAATDTALLQSDSPAPAPGAAGVKTP
jgi:hypothetical protein